MDGQTTNEPYSDQGRTSPTLILLNVNFAQPAYVDKFPGPSDLGVSSPRPLLGSLVPGVIHKGIRIAMPIRE